MNQGASLERPMPSSPEAENTIIAAIVIDNALISEAIILLRPEDFYVPVNKKMFLAMVGLFERGSEISPVLVKTEVAKSDPSAAEMMVDLIHGYMYGVPRSNSIAHYAKVVREKAMLRQVVKEGYKMAEDALAQGDEPEVILNNAQQAVFSLGNRSSERRVMSMKQITDKASGIVQGFIKGANPGLSTPWEGLNSLCRGGIQQSELWGIAALAKAGKSSIMKQWAQALGEKNRRVLIFTREMSEIKILFRMLSPMTDIPTSQIRYGLDESRVSRLVGAMKQIENYPIFIDAVTSNINDFRSRVRELIRLEGIEIVFGDYLQLFHSGLKKSDNRATEVGHVWRTMKDTAQDFNTRVVALAQFNREAYREKRPYFNQVEGSGEGEKAVDVGMVLTTDLTAGEPGARPATIHIDFQRDEDAGTQVDLIFDGRRMEFHPPYQPSPPTRPTYLTEDWNQ